MESVPDAHKFASAARRISRTKPVIVLKPGRTEAAARAAASHTGALTGRDDVLDAAFARCGVLRVDTIAELFNLAEVLDKQPPAKGPRLMMVTNAGGAGVLAADALLAAGGELADLAPATIEKLNAILPAHWSHHNPIDILGDADHTRYAAAVRIALDDPSTDGLLVALAPQAMTDPTAVACELAPILQTAGRPVLTSWMGGPAIAPGEGLLNEAGIPTFRYPDSAVRAFQSMWRHSANVKALADEPVDPLPQVPEHPLITAARDRGRTLLTEAESKQLLADFGIPTVPTIAAADSDAAVQAANKFGFPVVAKLHSETITHKSDVGGVRLNIADEAGVRAAWDAIREAVPPDDFLGVTVQPMVPRGGYELILGLSYDPQFGPVLLFGSGGTLVEVYKDGAIGLPPLNASLARKLMQRTKIHAALKGIRGQKPVDLAALECLLVNFARLAVEQPAIREVDINPLLASADRLIALDARIVLHTRDAMPAKPALLRY
jgi:acetyltransferase